MPQFRPKVSAYIPCFNNADTLSVTIESMFNQTYPVDELFIVDDGSSDHSVQIANQYSIPVISHACNRGRGATRACAIENAAYTYILSCDATHSLKATFLEEAILEFKDMNVAAVSGVTYTTDLSSAVKRWQYRHLLQTKTASSEKAYTDSLVTTGCVLKKDYILNCGNFDIQKRYKEDFELGNRLCDKGYKLIVDPNLKINSHRNHSWLQALERYSRWYSQAQPKPSFAQYKRLIGYALGTMVYKDLKDKDISGAVMSFLYPHYSLLRDLKEWTFHT